MQRPTTKAGSKTTTQNGLKSRSHFKPPSEPEGADNEDIPEDQWPKVARLKVGGLSQQGHLIRQLCRDAIRIVELALVTKHAWPELHKGTLYKRQVLLEAINALLSNYKDDNEGQQDTHYQVLRTRISEDDKFVRFIGKWVRNSKHLVNFLYILRSSRLSIGYRIIVDRYGMLLLNK